MIEDAGEAPVGGAGPKPTRIPRTPPSRDLTSDGGTWAAVLAVLAVGLLVIACFTTAGPLPYGGSRVKALLQSPWTGIAAVVMVVALVLAVWMVLVRHRSGAPDRTSFSWTSFTFVLAAACVVFVVIYGMVTATPVPKFSMVAEGRPRRRRLRGARRCASIAAPSAGPSSCTAGPVERPDLTDDEGATLHQMWARAAGHEAESIASFLQLEADLAAVGAPQELAERARAAAADEVRHTAFAARQARELGAEHDSSEPDAERLLFRTPHAIVCSRPVRQYRLLRLALESYVDGCCNEGAEVIRLRYAADHAAPSLSIELAAVADDETAHAELAWAVVEWALAEGGPAVGWALTHRPLPGVADSNGSGQISGRHAHLQARGWVPAAVRRDCLEQARASAITRLGTLTER